MLTKEKIKENVWWKWNKHITKLSLKRAREPGIFFLLLKSNICSLTPNFISSRYPRFSNFFLEWLSINMRNVQSCHSTGGLSPTFYVRTRFFQGLTVWNLWWNNRHWGNFFRELPDSSLPDYYRNQEGYGNTGRQLSYVILIRRLQMWI
jgi:hypothetical protein